MIVVPQIIRISIEITRMKEKQSIVIYGGGGGAVEIARYIRDQNESDVGHVCGEITDVIDDGAGRYSDLCSIVGREIKVHTSIDAVNDLIHKQFVVTLGNSPVRHQIYLALKEKGVALYTVVHPTAQISEKAKVGDGSIISPFVLLGAYSSIGENCFVNVRVTVGHDVMLGDSCILSPHVAVSGAVVAGAGVYCGAGAVINPGLSIGQFCKLSSGAVVAKEVKGGSLVYGNPARSVKMFNPLTGNSLFAPTG